VSCVSGRSALILMSVLSLIARGCGCRSLPHVLVRHHAPTLLQCLRYANVSKVSHIFGIIMVMYIHILYRNDIRNAIEEPEVHNSRALFVISRDMSAVQLCDNMVLQFLTADASECTLS